MQDRSSAGAIATLAVLLFLLQGLVNGLTSGNMASAALATGEITPETSYPVTNHAWRTGGAPSRTSTMFAAVRSRP